MATIQLKRGTSEALARVNPVLAAGEPCFVTDENRIKVGNGTDRWNDLPYMFEDNVVNASTHYDFPSLGKANVIYKAESEKLLYQWNATDNKYEIVGEVEISGDFSAVELIHGGNAFEN